MDFPDISTEYIDQCNAELETKEIVFKEYMLPELTPYFKENPLNLNIFYMDEYSVRFIIYFRKKTKKMEARFDINLDVVDLIVNKSNINLLNLNNNYQVMLDAVKKVTSDYRIFTELNLGGRDSSISNLERFLMQTTYIKLTNFRKKDKFLSLMQTRLDLKSGASLTLMTVYNNKTNEADISLEYSRDKKNGYVDFEIKLKDTLYDTFEDLAFRLFFNNHYSLRKTARNIDFVRMIRF